MRIREISAEDTYPVRQAALYPNGSRDKILLQDDALGQHLGLYAEDTLVSVLSLFQKSDGTQLRKFGTLPAHQGKGYGSYLLTQALAHCPGGVYLNARVDKQGFYQKFGFREIGETFTRNGLFYVVMAKGVAH